MGKLIAGGDSFIYGSELTDCIDTNGKEQISQLTYPALIAQFVNMDYVCVAQPGYSNAAIRRSVMNACEQYDDIDLVIVSWSFAGRYEFRINQKWHQVSPWSTVDSINDIERTFDFKNPIVLQHHAEMIERDKKSGITDFAKLFYKNNDIVGEYYDTLSNVIMLQQYLILHDIPYVFTAVDRNHIDIQPNIQDASLTTLKNQLNKLWGWFDDKGFYTWAKDNKFPFATTHPREEAHIEAAHIFYEHIRNFGWIS